MKIFQKLWTFIAQKSKTRFPRTRYEATETYNTVSLFPIIYQSSVFSISTNAGRENKKTSDEETLTTPRISQERRKEKVRVSRIAVRDFLIKVATSVNGLDPKTCSAWKLVKQRKQKLFEVGTQFINIHYKILLNKIRQFIYLIN